MREITVKNVGPVKEARLELKKINILIGQQSTGKSTLAKIACYCSWVEKEISIAQSPEEFKRGNYFIDNLTEFHKLEGFITPDSYISYTSDVLSFEYARQAFSFQWNEGRLDYQRRKTLYIPAERNIVSVIPNWFEVNLGDNSTRSFLADWERVRKHYSKDNPLPLLDLGKYYHSTSDNSDHILTPEGEDILLGNASSGLQTLTPLQALIRYYSVDFYKSGLNKKESTITQEQKMYLLNENLLNQLISTLPEKERIEWERRRAEITRDNKDILQLARNVTAKNYLFPNQEIENKYYKSLLQFQYASSTAFFIEEPELNLYPATQYTLVNTLTELVNRMDHTFFITTHSTYVLTSLNNLIFAGKVGQEHPDQTERVIPKNRWINKDDISAWKISADTHRLENLLAYDLDMLKAEELDDVSEIINGEFGELFEIDHQDTGRIA